MTFSVDPKFGGAVYVTDMTIGGKVTGGDQITATNMVKMLPNSSLDIFDGTKAKVEVTGKSSEGFAEITADLGGADEDIKVNKGASLRLAAQTNLPILSGEGTVIMSGNLSEAATGDDPGSGSTTLTSLLVQMKDGLFRKSIAEFKDRAQSGSGTKGTKDVYVIDDIPGKLGIKFTGNGYIGNYSCDVGTLAEKAFGTGSVGFVALDIGSVIANAGLKGDRVNIYFYNGSQNLTDKVNTAVPVFGTSSTGVLWQSTHFDTGNGASKAPGTVILPVGDNVTRIVVEVTIGG